MPIDPDSFNRLTELSVAQRAVDEAMDRLSKGISSEEMTELYEQLMAASREADKKQALLRLIPIATRILDVIA